MYWVGSLTAAVTSVTDEATAAVALVGADSVDTVGHVDVAVMVVRGALVQISQSKHKTRYYVNAAYSLT